MAKRTLSFPKKDTSRKLSDSAKLYWREEWEPVAVAFTQLQQTLAAREQRVLAHMRDVDDVPDGYAFNPQTMEWVKVKVDAKPE